jgi:hypothetical protein
MPNDSIDNDDRDDLVARLADARRDREALVEALREQMARAISAVNFGTHHEVFWPQVMRRIDVRLVDGAVAVKVVDETGKARIQLNSVTARFEPVGIDALAQEIRERWGSIFGAADNATSGDDQAKPKPTPNLTQEMKREKERERAEANRPLSETERNDWRLRNPWRAQTWNLTEQMRLLKRDPALADQLRVAVEAA